MFKTISALNELKIQKVLVDTAAHLRRFSVMKT